MQKTWAGSKIKQGVEEKKLTWSLGDVRCGVKLEAKRQDMLDALTKPQFELKVAPHAVQLRSGAREGSACTISVTMTPRASSSRTARPSRCGSAIGEIQAPAVVKGAIWTAAQLEDTFGVVHSDLVKEINRFVYERCPKRLAK